MDGVFGRVKEYVLALQRATAVTISHAKTVSVTLTRRRRVMKRILISYLAVVAAILGVVCFFSAGVSKGETSRSTGYISDGTRICALTEITPDNVETFKRYNAIINKLEDVGIDGLTAIERMLGSFMTNQMGCGTVAMDYRVIISTVKGDYALFFFDLGYGFETIVYLTWKLSIIADELL